MDELERRLERLAVDSNCSEIIQQAIHEKLAKLETHYTIDHNSPVDNDKRYQIERSGPGMSSMVTFLTAESSRRLQRVTKAMDSFSDKIIWQAIDDKLDQLERGRCGSLPAYHASYSGL